MIKSRIKECLQYIKEGGWLYIAIVFWSFLIIPALCIIKEDNPIWLTVSFIMIYSIYTVIVIRMIFKSIEKERKQEAEVKEKRLKELKIRYQYYISLVESQVQEILSKFANGILDEINYEINTSCEYLISFEEKKDWICKNNNICKLDSFIIASCLVYSILEHPIVTVKRVQNNENLEYINFKINFEFAMSCALKIISEPVTYYKDSIGNLTERKQQKVDIVVSEEVMKDIEENQMTLNNNIIHHDNRTYIMQFSNLLHVIYLNSQ